MSPAQLLRATKLKVRRCSVQWMEPRDQKHLLMLCPFPLQLIWKMMLDAHSVHSFEHPRLGQVGSLSGPFVYSTPACRAPLPQHGSILPYNATLLVHSTFLTSCCAQQIPIVQPVLHSCIQWRGAGMGNGEGKCCFLFHRRRPHKLLFLGSSLLWMYPFPLFDPIQASDLVVPRLLSSMSQGTARTPSSSTCWTTAHVWTLPTLSVRPSPVLPLHLCFSCSPLPLLPLHDPEAQLHQPLSPRETLTEGLNVGCCPRLHQASARCTLFWRHVRRQAPTGRALTIRGSIRASRC